MRPPVTELTAQELALALGRPYRTVARWLGVWHRAGVAGIRTVTTRARGGSAFRVEPDVVTRWKAGALPVPHESTARPLAA